MDLLIANPDGITKHGRQDCYLVNPATLVDLRVPTLGMVSVQDDLLLGGARVFLRCLPCESIPVGSISVAPWMLNRLSKQPFRVRVESMPPSEFLVRVMKLVVTPLSSGSDLFGNSHWIKPTNATNTHVVQNRTNGRDWIERSIKQRIEGQLASTGSIIVTKVKGQTHRFKVLEIELETPTDSNLGVITEDTLLEVVQEPLSIKETPFVCGGMDDLVQDICRLIVDSFRRADAYARLSIPNRKAAIITGVAGSGKKTAIRASCRATRLRVFPLSLARALSDREIMESDQALGLSYIRRVFDMALQSAPSAVVLEDLDSIAKDRGVDSLLQSSAVSILHKEMERARQGTDVFVFAVSRNRGKLPEVFLKQDLFQHEFQVPIPVKAHRQEILETLSDSLTSALDTHAESLKTITARAAQMSSGYVAKDLRNLYRSALLHSLRTDPTNSPSDLDMARLAERLAKTTMGTSRSTPSDALESNTSVRIADPLDWNDFAYAIEASKPSQQIEFESLVRTRNDTPFGGYASLKKRVHQAIHWPLTNPDTFRRMGVKPPMGLLLYGPPGCGKTMMVQTLASESSMNFIPIKGPEIFSKYLGETEATLRRLFAMARQIAPCILFFDEMDSIGAKRGWGGDGESQGSSGVNERVLSTLLNEMDGVEERTGVFVIGCTNQPRAMDDALLRPGRLDQLIYVGYPALQDRVEIIATIGKRIPLPADSETRSRLAQMTVGFSPADLDGLFREAAILSLRRDISSTLVDMRDIEQVIQTMKLSVQDRIGKGTVSGVDGSDVLVPDLYRRFQQER